MNVKTSQIVAASLGWRWKNKRRNRELDLIIILFIGLLCFFLTSCNLIAGPSGPTATLESKLGSISGVVWHDECSNFDSSEITPEGCIAGRAGVNYVADGILDATESGIQSANVQLGDGICPSEGLANIVTDDGGRYSFSGLSAGEYCVTVTDTNQRLGIWTFPRDDRGEGVNWATIVLHEGELDSDVNFGRDYLDSPPVPDATSTPTHEPTSTPTFEPTVTTTAKPCTDEATLVEDVTIPDGTRIEAGERFTKTWLLENSGTCTWTTEYSVVFSSGNLFRGPREISMPEVVQPGEEVEVSLDLRAPTVEGSYEGFWVLRNADNKLFGLGGDPDNPIWVQIRVYEEPVITEWRGEYFDNVTLEGYPALVRNDKEINFNWGQEAPDEDLPTDNFSVQWTRTVEFDDAEYRFHIRMDDGARFWLDDQRVVDEWNDGPAREITVDLTLEKGDHDITVEYYEKRGDATVRFWWEKLIDKKYAEWKATYWPNEDMDAEWGLVRNDEQIFFNWEFESPAPQIPPDRFSASWERTVEFKTGNYRFYARSDDGFRAFMDGALIIDEWHISNASRLYTAEMQLSGPHDLVIEYFEHRELAQVQFWWEEVVPGNEPPVAVDDSFTANKGQTLFILAPGVLTNDSDADGDSLTAILDTGPSEGSVTLNLDGSFSYSPRADFSGMDRFSYHAEDGKASSETAFVSIRVNTPPTVSDDVYIVKEDGILEVQAPGVLDNDSDDDGDPLTVQLEAEPDHGVISLNADGSFTYVPDPDFYGLDSFNYRVNDGHTDSRIASVTIEVSSVNDVPVAKDDDASTEDGQPIEIDVLENDSGLGDIPLTLTIGSPPGEGVAEVSENVILYTPYGGFSGVDTFTYIITDADGESSEATVAVTLSFGNP